MDIAALALEYGAANLRFFRPMSRLQMAGIIPGIAFCSHDAPRDRVECVVDESRYRVIDNYKITLRAVDPRYGSDHFYISDLESMIQSHPDEYEVYVLSIDGYQRIRETA
jgi:hypothetical protein